MLVIMVAGMKADDRGDTSEKFCTFFLLSTPKLRLRFFYIVFFYKPCSLRWSFSAAGRAQVWDLGLLKVALHPNDMSHGQNSLQGL